MGHHISVNSSSPAAVAPIAWQPRSFFHTSGFLSSGAKHRIALPTAALSLSDLVSLNNLKDREGSRKVSRRVGRGQGSSKGKTCGRGHKGQGQKSKKPRPGFEGGQTPLYKRVKKTGFKNTAFARPMVSINLSKIQRLIDRGVINPNEPITIKTLHQAGLFSRIPKHGVKVLSNGASWFAAKIDLYVTAVSVNAKLAIQRNGGRVRTVYYNAAGLRSFLRGEGPNLPGQPMPEYAYAPPALASSFDLPRAPTQYPVEDLEQIPRVVFLRELHPARLQEK